MERQTDKSNLFIKSEYDVDRDEFSFYLIIEVRKISYGWEWNKKCGI